MKKELAMILTAEVSGQDDTVCGDGCRFLEDGGCLLFGELEETELPPGYEWNGCDPTRQRHWRCH
jgi:hypothetical protein